MKEIVIISGKGGTGKTSVAASFASLAAGRGVIVDCDVDAADLHLILHPEIVETNLFRSGHKAVILTDKCTECGRCLAFCRFGAIAKTTDLNNQPSYQVDPISCEGCGVCVRVCPTKSISFPENLCGEWYVSLTRFGTLVHAILATGAENSGRLVTILRQKAKQLAETAKLDYVIIDGSPGIGCPVIASLTGATVALIVTEPTVSGAHDFQRIAELTRKLKVPAMVCVNKWDINPKKAGEIRLHAETAGIASAGNIRYDSAVTDAQRAGVSVIEYKDNDLAGDFRAVWQAMELFTEKGENK
ncbi:MAG: ATP-binding protein [Fibrobacteres bacterium]|nr:ATP-binding protein [Fibrobacterota bacterium]